MDVTKDMTEDSEGVQYPRSKVQSRSACMRSRVSGLCVGVSWGREQEVFAHGSLAGRG